MPYKCEKREGEGFDYVKLKKAGGKWKTVSHHKTKEKCEASKRAAYANEDIDITEIIADFITEDPDIFN